MLEQRRAREKGYITLKEAAQISHYAPDYIGQLIRAGKIDGEQVYSSVAWVTTEASIRAYMDANNKSRYAPVTRPKTTIMFEKISVYILYFVLGVSVLAAMSVFYIFSVTIDQHLEQQVIQTSLPESEHVLLLDVYE